LVPGTRVDVLLAGNPPGGGKRVTYVLANVPFFAVEQPLEDNLARKPQSVSVITLLVSVEDAQKLTLATSRGRIQLTLRNPIPWTKNKRSSPLKPIPPEVPLSPRSSRSS